MKVGKLRKLRGKLRGYVVGLSSRTMRGRDAHHAVRGWPRIQFAKKQTTFELVSRSAQCIRQVEGVECPQSSAHYYVWDGRISQ